MVLGVVGTGGTHWLYLGFCWFHLPETSEKAILVQVVEDCKMLPFWFIFCFCYTQLTASIRAISLHIYTLLLFPSHKVWELRYWMLKEISSVYPRILLHLFLPLEFLHKSKLWNRNEELFIPWSYFKQHFLIENMKKGTMQETVMVMVKNLDEYFKRLFWYNCFS